MSRFSQPVPHTVASWLQERSHSAPVNQAVIQRVRKASLPALWRQTKTSALPAVNSPSDMPC